MKFLNIKKTLAGMLDDTSYIQEIKHLSGMIGSVVWQQYHQKDIWHQRCDEISETLGKAY